MEEKLSNPAPLGLAGFGMTTMLLNIHNAGFFPIGTMILAMGIFYGGLAQIIAGILEYKKGNTFGTTAFTSYGLFWLTLVFIIVFKGQLPRHLRSIYGLVPLSMGTFHILYVVRYLSQEPGYPVCLPEPDHTLLASCHKGLVRKRHYRDHRGLGRYSMRVFRFLPCNG